MNMLIQQINSPLFDGIRMEDRKAVLTSIGYHIVRYCKGETVAFEEEHIHHIGIVLSGAVDMVKEDIWGNKTLLMRIRTDEMFGETFACGADTLSVVTFVVSQNTEVLFLPFDRIRDGGAECPCRYQLIENMLRIIAEKNRDLMRKIEVVSKKNLREKILAYLSIQSRGTVSPYVQIPFGRVELAEYLCADRSALTRELGRMKQDGLIDYDRNCFKLL